MTRYAKLLILAHVGLSLMFVAWSYGLYTQQLPWMRGQYPDREKAQIDELTEQVRNLVEARDRADARWFAASRAAVTLEGELPRRRNFHEAQLKIATTGTDPAGRPVDNPVKQLALLPNGLVNLTQAGQPVQIGGKPALSLAGFRAAIEKTLDEIRDTKQKINKVVADTTALTDEINGTKPPDQAVTAAEKGLRGQIKDAQQFTRNAVLEQEFLQSPVTNVTVELELLKRRQVALEARLKELAAAVFGGR
jgi:hypothetical protein